MTAGLFLVLSGWKHSGSLLRVVLGISNVALWGGLIELLMHKTTSASPASEAGGRAQSSPRASSVLEEDCGIPSPLPTHPTARADPG